MSPIFSKKKSFPAASEHSIDLLVTRTYEGRKLARQHEDIEDQGLTFDLGTLISRRRAFSLTGAGAGAILLAACSAEEPANRSSASTAAASVNATPSPTAAHTDEMPQETAGPYPGDGSNGPDVLDETGVERSNLTTSIGDTTAVAGTAMTMTIKIVDLANDNQPMVGAAVYVWHCDAQGNYSMYSDGVTDQTWLRGVQITGQDGTVTFNSIVPGCYTGRWPHIHFEVFSRVEDITDATNAILTSQIAVPEDVTRDVYTSDTYSGSLDNLNQITLESDNVFADGWDMQLAQVSGDVTKGYTLAIDVPIDTTTAPEQGQVAPHVGGPGSDGGAPPQPPTGN